MDLASAPYCITQAQVIFMGAKIIKKEIILRLLNNLADMVEDQILK